MKKLIVLSALFTVGACVCDHSDGERVGVPYKLSLKGLAVKTWEGEMNLGGMREKRDGEGNKQLIPNTFAFTVRPENVAARQQLQRAMEDGAAVRIQYHQVVGLTCASDSNYFVESVEVLKR